MCFGIFWKPQALYFCNTSCRKSWFSMTSRHSLKISVQNLERRYHLWQKTGMSGLLGKKKSWWPHFLFDDPHMLLIFLCPPWEHFSSSLFKITNTPTSCLGSYGNLIPFPKVVKAGILTFGKMRFAVIFRLK